MECAKDICRFVCSLVYSFICDVGIELLSMMLLAVASPLDRSGNISHTRRHGIKIARNNQTLADFVPTLCPSYPSMEHHARFVFLPSVTYNKVLFFPSV